MNRELRNQLFSLKKMILFGFIFLFVLFIFDCKFSHTNSDCNVHLILTSQLSSKENHLFYSILLFSLIAVNLFISFKKNQRSSFLNFSLSSPLILPWFWQFIFKIFNPILVALSRGIIHPQIYNSKFILG